MPTPAPGQGVSHGKPVNVAKNRRSIPIPGKTVYDRDKKKRVPESFFCLSCVAPAPGSFQPTATFQLDLPGGSFACEEGEECGEGRHRRCRRERPAGGREPED